MKETSPKSALSSAFFLIRQTLPSLMGPWILRSSFQTFNHCSFSRVSTQASLPQETNGRIIVLYISSLAFKASAEINNFLGGYTRESVSSHHSPLYHFSLWLRIYFGSSINSFFCSFFRNWINNINFTVLKKKCTVFLLNADEEENAGILVYETEKEIWKKKEIEE